MLFIIAIHYNINMKEKFLKLVAADLIKTYGANLSRFVLVFPYSAPIISMSNYLFVETNESLTKPIYTTISELFKRASGLTVSDKLELVCRLYKAYKNVLHKCNEHESKKIKLMDFDEFYKWGEMIVNDLNDVDKELINAKLLFKEVSNIKDISSEEYLTEEQKTTLQKFFKTFIHAGNSFLKENYLNIWRLLPEIYDEFNAINEQDGVAYEGSMFKKGLDVLKKAPLNQIDKYVFIGFNALNQVEKELMLYYKKSDKAIFYWDYDKAYCNGINEAGQFVVKNIEIFENRLDANHFNNLSKRNEVHIIESPTKSGSIYYAKTWLDNVSPKSDEKTVIVSANIDILPLLIHSLIYKPSKYVFNVKFPVNITATCAHIMRFIDKKAEDYNERIIENPCSAFILDIYNEINEYSNKIKTEEVLASTSDSLRSALEIQACESIMAIVEKIKTLIERDLLYASIKTIKAILQLQIRNSLIETNQQETKSTRVAESIDLCTLNDTRLFDYDNVLILGCNEGELPPSQHIPSLIPNHIRAIYNLPNTEKRNSICAYNFYRLLQRAENVSMIYVSEKSKLINKEPSRFIMQIIGEDVIPYTLANIVHPAVTQKQDFHEIAKTQEMFRQMKHLEATSLYQYILCPLMFFYSKVARIRTPKPDASKMPANLFGTLFHEAMQLFYESKNSKSNITKETLENALKNNGEALDSFINNAFNNNNVPDNTIIKKVVKEYMRKILEYDMNNAPFQIQPQFIEKFLYTTIPVKIKNGEIINVRIGGKFDRVDKINIEDKSILRVVDYKTSRWKKQLETKDVESIFGQPKKDKHYDYIFQTFLYCLALDDNIKNKANVNETIAPAVFFITACSKKDFEPYINYGNNGKLLDFSEVKSEFKDRLTELLNEIFDIDKPFREGYKDSCTYCNYKLLCNK